MKKVCCFTLIMLLLFSSTGGALAVETDDALALQGLRLIADMDALAESEKYIELYISSEDIAALAAAVGAEDYDAPVHIYRLSPRMNMLNILMKLYSLQEGSLPDAVERLVLPRLMGSLAPILNGRNEASWMAVFSALAVSDCFAENLNKPVLYIYEYPHEYSAIVSFVPGQSEDAVAMTANFVRTESIVAEGQLSLDDSLLSVLCKIETLE